MTHKRPISLDDIDFSPSGPNPPQLLAHEDPNGGCHIGFREGARVVFRNRKPRTPRMLFMTTLTGSMALDGQPVRCTGFVPGVSLRILAKQTDFAPRDVAWFVEQVWIRAQPAFEQWLADPTNPPGLNLESAEMTAQFARDTRLQLRPGVMQIELPDDVSAPASEARRASLVVPHRSRAGSSRHPTGR
jgi:hypothetical protein